MESASSFQFILLYIITYNENRYIVYNMLLLCFFSLREISELLKIMLLPLALPWI